MFLSSFGETFAICFAKSDATRLLRMRLELQGDEDRGVVGRMAEIAQATRVAGQCRETVVDEFCGTYSLEERTGHVNEIDPLAGERTLLELTGMQTLHDIDVRSMPMHIVMHQESLVILGQAINLIVHTGACRLSAHRYTASPLHGTRLPPDS